MIVGPQGLAEPGKTWGVCGLWNTFFQIVGFFQVEVSLINIRKLLAVVGIFFLLRLVGKRSYRLCECVTDHKEAQRLSRGLPVCSLCLPPSVQVF